jgi:1-acyl-sn-glycerol-3-phosphate acyltransferase
MLYTVAKKAVEVFYKTRFKIKVIGADRVPASGPVLICSNHISDFDPPLIGISLKREMSFFAKAELFKIPIFGNIVSRLNTVPVERGKSDRIALKKAVETLQEGRTMLVFPEGSRSKDRQLGDFQQGASFMAVKAGAKIVPTAIKGSYNRKEGVTVIFGKSIDTQEMVNEGKNRKEITVKLREDINNLLFSE